MLGRDTHIAVDVTGGYVYNSLPGLHVAFDSWNLPSRA